MQYLLNGLINKMSIVAGMEATQRISMKFHLSKFNTTKLTLLMSVNSETNTESLKQHHSPWGPD